MSVDPALSWALRGALALVWLRAAFHKWRDLRAFRQAVAGYDLLPGAAVPVVAAAFAAAEVGLAGALLWPSAAATAALASAGLLALYAGAIAINLARGRRDVDCGCAGPGASRPLGGGLLVRNAVLAFAALLAAAPLAGRPLLWLDGLTVVGGAAALALLHAAIEQALAHGPAQRALRAAERRRAWSTH